MGCGMTGQALSPGSSFLGLRRSCIPVRYPWHEHQMKPFSPMRI